MWILRLFFVQPVSLPGLWLFQEMCGEISRCSTGSWPETFCGELLGRFTAKFTWDQDGQTELEIRNFLRWIQRYPRWQSILGIFRTIGGGETFWIFAAFWCFRLQIGSFGAVHWRCICCGEGACDTWNPLGPAESCSRCFLELCDVWDSSRRKRSMRSRSRSLQILWGGQPWWGFHYCCSWRSSSPYRAWSPPKWLQTCRIPRLLGGFCYGFRCQRQPASLCV